MHLLLNVYNTLKVYNTFTYIINKCQNRENRQTILLPQSNKHKTKKYQKIMAPGPIISWQINGETMETVRDFILQGAPKSLQMVTVAMKLKDTYSLEEKLMPT